MDSLDSLHHKIPIHLVLLPQLSTQYSQTRSQLLKFLGLLLLPASIDARIKKVWCGPLCKNTKLLLCTCVIFGIATREQMVLQPATQHNRHHKGGEK